MSTYGSSFGTATESSKYITRYPENETAGGDGNTNSAANYVRNTKTGDAIKETSTAGTGATGWNSDSTVFPRNGQPFMTRGGQFSSTTGAGLTQFYARDGNTVNHSGFRVVLCP